jgi:hypothetical protein
MPDNVTVPVYDLIKRSHNFRISLPELQKEVFKYLAIKIASDQLTNIDQSDPPMTSNGPLSDWF